MRIIHIKLIQDKIIIEIDKKIIEIDNVSDINSIGLSIDNCDKLKTAILKAQEKSLNEFTLKY